MTDLKNKTVTIELDNADKGKKFLITEMPLLKADKWAWSLGHGLFQGGINDDLDVNNLNFNTTGGILEVAKLGMSILKGLPRDLMFELMDELTESCVQYVAENGQARPLVDGDITNVVTLNLLRKEALAIHIDFLKIVGR